MIVSINYYISRLLAVFVMGPQERVIKYLTEIAGSGYMESAPVVNGEDSLVDGGAQKSCQTGRQLTLHTHSLHQISEARSFFAASTMFARAWRVSGQPRVFRPQSGLTHRRS